MASPHEITDILANARSGNPEAIHRLMPLVYSELHALAQHAMRGQRAGHTLQATALVHESFLRLVGGAPVSWQDRVHFVAVAAKTMRQILVDHARAQRAEKRGGNKKQKPITLVAASAGPEPLDLLALDEALIALSENEPRSARVVELRFFGGLTREEVAEVLGLTVRTVDRDWKFAQGWLHREMNRS